MQGAPRLGSGNEKKSECRRVSKASQGPGAARLTTQRGSADALGVRSCVCRFVSRKIFLDRGDWIDVFFRAREVRHHENKFPSIYEEEKRK